LVFFIRDKEYINTYILENQINDASARTGGTVSSGYDPGADPTERIAMNRALNCLLVVHKGDHSLGYCDLNSGDELARVALDPFPHEFAR